MVVSACRPPLSARARPSTALRCGMFLAFGTLDQRQMAPTPVLQRQLVAPHSGRPADAHELANTAWTRAAAGLTASSDSAAIATESASRLRELTPLELARLAWAYTPA